MTVRLIIPDDEPYIFVRSAKLNGDGTINMMHSFAGFLEKDADAIDESIEVNICGNTTSS